MANTTMAERIPFNSRVLKWARERRHFAIEDAAKRAAVSPDRLTEWESGDKSPTVKQARKLADVYRRPFLEFFSLEIPEVSEAKLVPDFRLHRDAPDPKKNFELLEIQRWAEEQRLNALDLFEMLGEAPPRFQPALYASTSSDAEAMAALVRKSIGFSIDKQISLKGKEKDDLPKLLRREFERAGVMVLRRNSLAKCKARGVCIFAEPLPVIVFGDETAGGQAFTLAHEFAHVMLKQSAISGGPSDYDPKQPIRAAIERWCNEFAAAFLMPAGKLRQLIEFPAHPNPSIPDSQLVFLARFFAVSQHAMMIRLVRLNIVEARYYWDVKRPQFLAMEAAFKSGGRPKYYGSRYRNARGDLYTGLVLEAWNTGRITNHNAAEFMGTKSIGHVEDIRENFGR
jgi:Zn-dependent peptidase ImmA (M78 family)/DNA-binding XRE family transcriptional regulator